MVTSMSVYAGLASGFVVVVLAGAVLGKVSAWDAWTGVAGRLTVGSPGRRVAVLVLVPVVELLLVLFLVRSPAAGLAGSAVLFATFAVGVHLGRDRLRGSSCACFGNLLPGTEVHGLVPRNVGLCLLALTGSAAYVVSSSPVDIAVLGGMALALATAFVVRRLAAGRGSRGGIGPLLGEPAYVSGTGEGSTTLVVILAPGCPACEEMAGQVDLMRAQVGAERLVTAVVGGSEPARSAMAARVGDSAQLDLDDLMVRWQVPGTPYLVAVDADGAIIGASAVHDDGLARLRTALSGATPARERSRRQLLSLTSAWSLAALAGAATIPRWQLAADADPNTFRGGCGDFAEYARDVGLYVDHQGGKHPSHHHKEFGYTLAWPEGSSTVDASADELDRKVLKDVYGICDCPAKPLKFYVGQEQVTQCVTECPSGLGCFAWQCKVTSGLTCVRAIVNIHVAPPPLTITRLQWIPPKGSSKGCQKYAAQQNADTLRHEQHHVRDNKAVIAELEKEFKGRPVYGCGADEKEAERELKRKVNDLVESVRRQAIKRSDQRTEDFHDAQDGTLTFDCRVCGE